MFDAKLIKHLAELGKLNYSEAEIEHLTGEMDEIIALMDTVADFRADTDTNNNEAVPFGELRIDAAAESFPREEILGNAADRTDTCFKVPKVV